MSRLRATGQGFRRITDATAFGQVAVLMGGASAEREISLLTGNAVLEALVARGVDASAFDPAERALTELVSAGCDRVWIALHGPGGEDGAVQGALEWLGLPYTGSGVLGSAIGMDKRRTKELAKAAGVATPAWMLLTVAGFHTRGSVARAAASKAPPSCRARGARRPRSTRSLSPSSGSAAVNTRSAFCRARRCRRSGSRRRGASTTTRRNISPTTRAT